jgi:replicative DNA helicase
MPQAVDMEAAVLGALLIERDSFDTANTILSPEMFYNKANEAVFKAIQTLSEGRRPIDMLTVVQTLKTAGELEMAGGAHYISRLTANVASSAHLEYHCLVVREKYISRKLIEICNSGMNMSFDESEDADDVVAKLNGELEEVMEIMAGKKDTTHISKASEQSIKQMYKRIEERKKGITPGIPTGFADLDRRINGWKPERLYIIAARPGVGKTSLATQFARKAAEKGYGAVFFSLEMGETELTDKMIVGLSDISADDYSAGSLSRESCDKAEMAMMELFKLPIYIDDKSSMTVTNIANKARLLKKQGKCDIVFIDYLQLLQPMTKQGRTREQEVSEMTRMLKVHAKELKIPFVVLCQMNRDIEKENREPYLSDLRESGSIEQDADLVMFIWRPKDVKSRATGEQLNNYLELLIRKHRGGKTGKVGITHNESMSAFYDYDNRGYSNYRPIDYSEPTKEDGTPF